MSKKHGSQRQKQTTQSVPAPDHTKHVGPREGSVTAKPADPPRVLLEVQSNAVTREMALVTSNDRTAFPDHTEAPGSKIPRYTNSFAAEGTNAPKVGQTEQIQGELVKSQSELAKSPSELADKYLFSQLRKGSIAYLIPLIPILWIFVQDNGAGRLQTREGVLWCLTKCAIVLLLCTIPLMLALIRGWLDR
jgi:hypothetical protein